MICPQPFQESSKLKHNSACTCGNVKLTSHADSSVHIKIYLYPIEITIIEAEIYLSTNLHGDFT